MMLFFSLKKLKPFSMAHRARHNHRPACLSSLSFLPLSSILWLCWTCCHFPAKLHLSSFYVPLHLCTVALAFHTPFSCSSIFAWPNSTHFFKLSSGVPSRKFKYHLPKLPIPDLSPAPNKYVSETTQTEKLWATPLSSVIPKHPDCPNISMAVFLCPLSAL